MEVKYNEIELEVEFNYTPGEPPVSHYPDGSGYPGSSPSLEFKILTEGPEIDAFTSEDLENIEELIWFEINNQNLLEPDYPEDDWNNEN